MSLLNKEYRPILAASILGLLCVGGSGFFCWSALTDRTQAEADLKNKGEELNRLMSAGAPPTKDHLKQLQKQLESSEASVKTLRSALESMDVPLERIQPQEFQASMNTKARDVIAKAQKYRIPIPSGARESEPFSLDLDEFIKKLPSEDRVPMVHRQLIAAERLMHTLLESKPLAVRSFKVDRIEESKADAKVEKADPKGGQARASSAPVLSSLGFEIWFGATPDSLRDFLNALTKEKRGLFVPRRMKITTVAKDASFKDVRDNRDIRPMEAPRKGEIPQPVESSVPAGQRKPEPVAQYILGDEHIEVEMRLELLSTLPPTADTVTNAAATNAAATKGAGEKRTQNGREASK